MASAPIGGVLRQINRLFVEGTISGLPDGQLLERFIDGHDEAAFTALVERHGPMVLNTCRAVLRDPGAAEDAFQATFLVLVCKARTIRGRESLGGWLHRVAYRNAVQASSDAARKRTRERLFGDLRVEDKPRSEPSDDWREILHEEVARLSEKYRLPVLLCDLEGKTHAQAANELKWGEATVRRRLTGARDLLRSRLARRGVALSAAGLVAALGRSVSAGVPAAWVDATVKGAGTMSSNAARIAIGEVVSTTAAALARKSLRAMLLSNVKNCATVAIVFGLLGCISWAVVLPQSGRGQAGGSMPGPRPAQASPPAQPKAEEPSDLKATITYQGHVLDPTGRPYAGAALYLITYGLKQPKNPPVRATSGADGRFRFEVAKSDFDPTYEDAPWSFSTVVARAKGYAFGLANDRGDAKELTLQLIADDVPVSGRIIDLEGRPVAGVIVKVLDVRAPDKASLGDWLKALEERKELYNLEHLFLPNGWDEPDPSVIPPIMTGLDGKFRIEGIGRERVSTLQLEGPTIETKQVEVRTRLGETIRVPGYAGGKNPDLITIYGAGFEHVAGPTRPIEGVVRDQDTGKPLAGVMVGGERALGNPYLSVQSITDSQGKYRLVGLPRGKEGYVLAVPPCDFPVFGSRKAELHVPRDKELPYLRARVAVKETRETGPVHLDIKLMRGVWVSGRVIDKVTGKPARGQVEYFVYTDNPHLSKFPDFRWSMIGPHFTFKDGAFHLVAFPGPGILAARGDADRFVRGTGVDSFTHKQPKNGMFESHPHYVVPVNYHTLAEIDPAAGAASLTHDLLLETGRSLTVTVLSPDGKPLTGTQISGLKDMSSWEATPADRSTHSIENLKPGKQRVLSFLDQAKRLTGELVLRGDETVTQKVILQPFATLTGRVVNSAGEPWGEAWLFPIVLPSGYPKLGKDGRFRIEGLIPGKSYSLRLLVNHSRLEGFIVKDVKVGPGEVKDLGDVVPETPKAE